MAQVTVTIDGQSVKVGEGTTILDAARQLGIEIPTLCFVNGFDPACACFLCAVEVEGRSNLVPACGMPVAEGMVVTTSSDQVRETRKMALELLLSDHAGDCVAPCHATCPAGLDIPGFVYHVATRMYRRATKVVAERLALPGALGRICPRLCEDSCRRCNRDEGLAIAALHRYTADRDVGGGEPYRPPKAEASGKKAAIVGAGPAGIAAAYYLLQDGHECTLFDAHPLPGGMLRYGIPEYRLPKAALDAEIDVVRRLGARFELNSRWGVDFSLEDLRQEFDAVFLAVGAQISRQLGCEGDELAMSGIEFLARVARGERPDLGGRVVVVGGGNTAMDACRTAVRLGAEKVTVIYRRMREQMPCLMEEVDGAEVEGVKLEYLVAPIGLERSRDGSLRVTCQRMELGEPDASGRRRPVPLPGSEFSIEADTVIAAIGQSVERSLAESEGLEVSKWGFAADSATLATNLPGVFAGGDAVLGADLAVRAVAAGRLAAMSMNRYLKGLPVTGDRERASVMMRSLDEDELAAVFRGIERTPRTHGQELDMETRRKSFDEIEAGLTERGAVVEARRCLSCGCRKSDGCLLRDYATEYGADPYRFSGERRRFSQDLTHPEIVYEPGKCILCDACVHIAKAEGEPLGVAVVGRGFKVRMSAPFDEPLREALRIAARRCAEACPTGALALRTQRACDACSLLPECTAARGPDGDGGCG